MRLQQMSYWFIYKVVKYVVSLNLHNVTLTLDMLTSKIKGVTF